MAGFDGLAFADAGGEVIVPIIPTLKDVVAARAGCVIALTVGKISYSNREWIGPACVKMVIVTVFFFPNYPSLISNVHTPVFRLNRPCPPPHP